MAAYLSQLIPRLSINGGSNKYIQTEQGKTPKLQYITIYNPDFIDSKAETNEELMEQILTFISTNEGDDLESSRIEQIRIIGLIQAIEGFSGSFNTNVNEEGLSIIKSTKSSIIVKQIEGQFRIACSVSMPENGIKESAINHQMSRLLTKSYDFFKLLNTSFQNILDSYNKDILKNLIDEHWGGFLHNYNSENFKFPATVKWPNSLNYKGFLQFFPNDSYKKSSIELKYDAQVEVDSFCQDRKYVPDGLMISCFNKNVPKEYGLIYSKAYGDITNSSIIDIYNLLEYYDYHEKLTTEQFTKLSNDDLFSSPKVMKETINVEFEPEVESGFLANSANTAIELLNPINLTNNLVISPLNYTMNSMIQLRDTRWLKVPSYLKFGAEDPVDPPPPEAVEDGTFIVGLVDGIIYRKLVCLSTTTSKQEREYSLIIHKYKDIYVTLIYESSVPDLDDINFYKNLREEFFPIVNELSVKNNINLETSISSLPLSTNEIAECLDSDFFFIIYDKNDNHIKSSLPYLPLPINGITELNEINKSNLNIRSAMFYLHDQLLDLFFLQNETFFFKPDSIEEYFHKFKTNKINDWMFYYLNYHDSYIIIIKNLNHNKRRKKKYTTATVSNISTTDGVESDLKLGILESLGEDVKLWFDNFKLTGDV